MIFHCQNDDCNGIILFENSDIAICPKCNQVYDLEEFQESSVSETIYMGEELLCDYLL